jgi:hypothetical protein
VLFIAKFGEDEKVIVYIWAYELICQFKGFVTTHHFYNVVSGYNYLNY